MTRRPELRQGGSAAGQPLAAADRARTSGAVPVAAGATGGLSLAGRAPVEAASVKTRAPRHAPAGWGSPPRAATRPSPCPFHRIVALTGDRQRRSDGQVPACEPYEE